MSIPKLLKIILLVFAMMISALAYGQESEFSRVTKLPNPDFDNTVVANVADLEITSSEFVLNYEFGPSFLKRQKDSKRRYLEIMIYEKLLALEGYEAGLLDLPSAQRSLREIHNDLITEEFYKDEILSRVNLTQKEIDRGVTKSQIEVELKWLYSNDPEVILTSMNKLNSGTPFDSLFKQQISDSVKSEDRQWRTNLFKLQQQNPELYSIVDTLKIRQFSNPIKTGDGWYIVLVNNIVKSVIIGEAGYQDQYHKVKKLITKQKSDSLSDEYVREMMIEHDPVIDRQNFNILRAKIGKEFLRPEKFSDWDLPDSTGNAELSDSMFVKLWRDSVLVSYKSGSVTIGEFWDWYEIRKQYLKFNTNTRESYFVSVQQSIWRMLRDKLLIERAQAAEISKLEIVKIQEKWWRDKIVYSAMKEKIAASIDITEERLIQFYNDNLHNYKGKNGHILPFEKVKNNVKSEYYREEYMAKLIREIQKLKQKYKISVNDEVLANTKVEDEENPKTIDVYTVKKGGTLPRQPYPTIDWEWQSWY